MVFSGSAVVDRQNSSGLCENPDASDRSCLIAIYTGHTGTVQTQNIAFSNDRGRTWTKYAGNPVIDLKMRDFRDPKVIWRPDTRQWVMVTALAREKKVRFFGSPNLREWRALSDFGPAGAAAGVWECPDLFPLPVEGRPGEERWVLAVSINPGGPAGGSGSQYFVGRFDGTRFLNENPPGQILWIDYGPDFYAVQSFSDVPPEDGRRLLIGWLSNWLYAGREPTAPWRTAQSIPLQVRLKRFPEGIRLVQEPAAELRRLRSEPLTLSARGLPETNRALASRKGTAWEMIVDLDLGSAAQAGLKIRSGASEETVVGVRRDPAEFFVDRTRSGNVGFHEKFPARHTAPSRRAAGSVRLHVFVDWSSVEVFAGHGEVVISERIFPSARSDGVQLYAEGGDAAVSSLGILRLRSIWEK